MGAGIQRWWRSYEDECEAWRMRDILEEIETPTLIVTRYKDGSTVITDKRAAWIVTDA